MEFLSVGQHARGVIAIGQEAEGILAIGQIATGVVAIGQMATGVVAVGQLARGVYAVGMLSVGLSTVGMVSIGVLRTTAMLGAAAVAGRGGVWGLMPFPRVDPYGQRPFDDIVATRTPGFVRGRLVVAPGVVDGSGSEAALVLPDGRPVGATIDVPLRVAALRRAGGSEPDVLARLVPTDDGRLLVDRLVALPPNLLDRAFRARVAAATLLLLGVIALVFHGVVTLPLVDFVVRFLQAS